jgi:hypothetical protein
MAPTVSGPVRRALAPTKKYLTDQIKIDYNTLSLTQIRTLHDKILTSLKRFANLQNQLLEIPEDEEEFCPCYRKRKFNITNKRLFR